MTTSSANIIKEKIKRELFEQKTLNQKLNPLCIKQVGF